MVTEMLRVECDTAGVQLTEAESTLLALGIHADTGIYFTTVTSTAVLRVLGCVVQTRCASPTVAVCCASLNFPVCTRAAPPPQVH